MPRIRLFFLLATLPFYAPIAAQAETNFPVEMPSEEIKKLLTAPTVQNVVTTYSYIGLAAYGDTHLGAEALFKAVKDFKKDPSESNFTAMREAWLAARKPYLMTEAFRFYDGPIDVFTRDFEVAGPEIRMNAWPIRPEYFDVTTKGGKDSLIASTKSLKAPSLREENMRDDDRNVSAGFHVLEYLLWGEPTKDGKGTRSISDFTSSKNKHAQRRLAMLLGAAELMTEETQYLRAEWFTLDNGSYAQQMTRNPTEAMGKILTGLITLSAYELPQKHLGLVANDGDAIRLQSPYSRTSYADLVQTVSGMRQILLGEFGPVKGPGIIALAATKDPNLAKQLDRENKAVVEAAKAMPNPMEDALPAKEGSDAHKAATKLADALKKQAQTLVAIGKLLQVPVEVTGD